MRYRGPFAWQGINSTRLYEYPWAYHTIRGLGEGLTIVDLGGGLGGLQFVLAAEGYRVMNVDPGLAARGLGWDLSAERLSRLCTAYGVEVDLRVTTIGAAGIANESVDVLLSISTIEHLADEDLEELARHAGRILKPGGHAVFTVDLFLDVMPFAPAVRNRWGRNLDVRKLLQDCALDLTQGEPTELLGFPEFNAQAVAANIDQYLVGEYPAMAQCIVARCRRTPVEHDLHSL